MPVTQSKPPVLAMPIPSLAAITAEAVAAYSGVAEACRTIEAATIAQVWLALKGLEL